MSIATISSIAPKSPIRHGVTILGIEATFPIATPTSPSASAMRTALLLEKRIEAKRRRAGATWRRRKQPNPMVPQRPSPLPKQNPQPRRSKLGEALAVTRKPNPPQRQNLLHTPSKPQKPSLLRARSNPRSMRRGQSRLAGPEPPPTGRKREVIRSRADPTTPTAQRAADTGWPRGAAVPDMAVAGGAAGASAELRRSYRVPRASTAGRAPRAPQRRSGSVRVQSAWFGQRSARLLPPKRAQLVHHVPTVCFNRLDAQAQDARHHLVVLAFSNQLGNDAFLTCQRI